MKALEIQALLPAVFRGAERTDPVQHGMLDAMEALHAPCERAVREIAANFDPWRTPEKFVPFLSGWVTLSEDYAVNASTHRALIAATGELARQRGTLAGLCLFLETATGASGFELHENVSGPEQTPRPFHLRVVAPRALKSEARRLRLIIERDKPAYVTYELDWWPP